MDIFGANAAQQNKGPPTLQTTGLITLR